MALIAGSVASDTGLAGEIATELEAVFGAKNFDRKTAGDALDAIAKAVVLHIQANAEVSTPNGAAGTSTLAGTVS